jgi:TonB family protein
MLSTILHSIDNRKSRAAGVAITLFVHLLALLVFFRTTFLSAVTIPLSPIEIVFEPEPKPEELKVLQLNAKLPASGKKTSDTPPKLTEATTIDDRGDVEVPVQEPVEIDKRSIFRSEDVGTTADNASGEDIDSRALFAGDQHTPFKVNEDVSAVSLNGRSVVGELEQPVNTSNREGQVVIEITVDQYGKVTQARTRARSTSIQNAALWKAAEEAAQKTLFSTDLDAPPLQRGTITYVFRLK